jgi:fatty acid desaturase
VLFVAGRVLPVVAPLPLLAARLLIIGHDACHGVYTDSPRQNRRIGKIAFLPSLTPYRWREVVQHGAVSHHGACGASFEYGYTALQLACSTTHVGDEYWRAIRGARFQLCLVSAMRQ